jgi:hypothetical protein
VIENVNKNYETEMETENAYREVFINLIDVVTGTSVTRILIMVLCSIDCTLPNASSFSCRYVHAKPSVTC